jgi:hypothetical protein
MKTLGKKGKGNDRGGVEGVEEIIGNYLYSQVNRQHATLVGHVFCFCPQV